MATDVIDFAGLEDSAAQAEPTQVDSGTPDADVEPAKDPAEGTEPELNEDGSEKTEEQKAEAAKTAVKDSKTAVADTKVTPDSISKALKAMKDSNPANAGAAKVLRDAYFGEQAFKKEFSSVQAAREAKAFIAAVGGAEGWESAQGVIQNIEESDQLVHAGDPQIWNNIVEDLKSEGHLEALPKLAAGGLDTLKAHDEDQYLEVIKPHFLAGLEAVNLPKAAASLTKYLEIAEQELAKAEYKGETRGLGALKTITKDLNDWIKGLQDEAKTKTEASTKVDPEREKFNKEREEFNKQKSEKEQNDVKEFKTSVATEQEKSSNKILGKDLATYLRMPFFKGMPQNDGKGGHAPWALDLGNGIKADLYRTLEADPAYKTFMKAQWKQKSPDRAKIVQFHNDTVDRVAPDVVKRVVESRYPGYAKGGSAAGRVAAASVKKAAESKTSEKSVATGTPVYVSSKPKDLIRDPNVVKDWQMLEITGKGYVKGTDQKLRLVTWRK